MTKMSSSRTHLIFAFDGPQLGGETIDYSKERVVGGFARGAAEDDGAIVAEDGDLVVVGLGACSGIEAESACVVSGEKQ